VILGTCFRCFGHKLWGRAGWLPIHGRICWPLTQKALNQFTHELVLSISPLQL